MNEDFPHLDAARRAILQRALEIAPFEGWTRKTLIEAADEAGLPSGAYELYLPGGPPELIDFWGKALDAAMAETLASADLSTMRIREKVAFAVMARFEPMAEHREAGRRALIRLGLPDAGGAGPRILWRAADAVWSALGDKSTDGNWYSKRAILSGVIGSTLPIFLEDKSADFADTRAFLDHRIDNVMQFEKAKAQFRDFKAKLPDPLRTLSRLRYPEHSGFRRYGRRD